MRFFINSDTKKIEGYFFDVAEDIPEGIFETTIKPEDYDEFNSFRNIIQNTEVVSELEINDLFRYDEQESMVIKRPLTEIAEIEGNKLVNKLDKRNTEYIKSRYTLERQTTFLMQKVNAIGLQRLDIVNELNKIETFLMTYPLNYYYIKEQEIKDTVQEIKDNTKTLDDLYNLENTWDFEQFNQYDPNIHIEDIKNMF
jgi:hypothetical protein